MNLNLHLRLCAYTLALLGGLSVTLTDFFPPIWAMITAAAVVLSWFYQGPRGPSRAYRRVWMAIGLCALVLFFFDLVLFGQLLLPAVHVSMLAQAYLLFNRKNTSVYRQIFVVSFFQMLASTQLTTGIMFAAILAAYCLAAVYGLVLLQLARSLGTADDPGIERPAERRVPRGLFVTALAFTALLVPLSLAVFYSAPRLRYTLVPSLRGIEAVEQTIQARARTGFKENVQLGTYGRIQEDRTIVLRVEIPAGSAALKRTARWRGGALNIYDGTTWSSSRDDFAYFNGKQWRVGSKNSGVVFPKDSDIFITDERYARYDRPEQFDADAGLLKQVVYVEVPFSDNIFGAGYIKAVQGPFKYGVGQDFNRSFFMKNRPALPELISYTAYSEVYEFDEAGLRQVAYGEFRKMLGNEQYGSYVRTHYLQVPPELDPRIVRLTRDVTQGARTPYEAVTAIQDFLETRYDYSLNPGIAGGDDPLAHFLFVTRRGHCEYFATAMTLMARIAGIPARLARGFQRGEWNEGGGFFEVRQRDAHTWTEVFFPGHGWLPFDPSPRAVADEYFERDRSMIARAISKRTLILQILWREHIVGYNETRRLRLFAGVKDLILRDVPATVLGPAMKFAGRMWGIMRTNWILDGLLAAVLILAALLAYRRDVLFTLLPWSLGRSKRGRSDVVFYERMLRLLEKRKIVKPAYVTPMEFLDFPTLREHPTFSDIESLTAVYYRVRFGGETLAVGEDARINDILRRLKRANGRRGNPGQLKADVKQ